jgi:hypothetical protein
MSLQRSSLRTFASRLTLLALSLSPLSAALITLNTGTASWQVSQTAGSTLNSANALNVSSPAVVLTGTLPFAANLPGFEAFAWANPFGGAVWVGQLNTDGQFTNGGSITCGSPCGATAGNYVYTLTIDAILGGSLTINGFTADNGVRSLSVVSSSSGTLYSCTVGTCPATQTNVAPSTGVLNFDSGTVTITALVQNLDGPGRNPSGFILAGSATLNESSAVPEPTTTAMLALGAIAMLTLRRR